MIIFFIFVIAVWLISRYIDKLIPLKHSKVKNKIYFFITMILFIYLILDMFIFFKKQNLFWDIILIIFFVTNIIYKYFIKEKIFFKNRED
jgi:hypothetical protein